MNKVVLIGRLVRDVDIRSTQAGLAIGHFTLAVDKNMSREKRDAAKQQGKPTANFITCTAFGKRAETIGQYFHKGSLIGVSGELNSSSYQAQDGSTRYTTEVWVDGFDFLGGNQNTAAQASAPAQPARPAPARPAAPPPTAHPQQQSAPPAQTYQAAPAAAPFPPYPEDDEIPF